MIVPMDHRQLLVKTLTLLISQLGPEVINALSNADIGFDDAEITTLRVVTREAEEHAA